MEALKNNQTVTFEIDNNPTTTMLVNKFIKVNEVLRECFIHYIYNVEPFIRLRDRPINSRMYQRKTKQQLENTTEGMYIIENLQKISDEEKLKFFYLSISNRDVELLSVEELHNKITINQAKNHQTALATTNKKDYLPEVYQQIFADKTKRTDIPLSYNIASDVPVNFIWLGSLLPDRYLKNIIRTGLAQPKKEIILWIDKKWLTSEEYSQMQLLPTLPALQDIDIKVLDINKAKLEQVSIEGKEKFQQALSFARDKLDNKAVASDLLRYALLTKGPDAINQASGLKKDRSSTGMFYMDTDRGPKTDEPLEWGEMKAPAGFLIPGNKNRGNSDILATSYAMHPIFLLAFKKCISNLSNPNIQNKLLTAKGTSSFVLENTGPILLKETMEEFIATTHLLAGCLPNHITFQSEVAGPICNDMTWFIDSAKTMPDLSATWEIQTTSKSATWEIQTTSKQSGCLIS
jgi:uncharacterized small protein (DUF1192 family)